MKALAVRPGTPGLFALDIGEPSVLRPSEVRLRVLQTGVCGTDREEIAGGRCSAPEGEEHLVIGHETVGEVVEVGAGASRVQPGDLAVLTVRHGCANCIPCTTGRSDMCRTGGYRERGIRGLHGYQCEFVVEEEAHVVGVPSALREVAVLCEPLSIVEKGITEAVRVQQARLPEAAVSASPLQGKQCLVAGLGPVGLLAAMALRLRGAVVTGIDIVPAASPRPELLRSFGGSYVDISAVPAGEVDRHIPRAEMVFEAAGVPSLVFDLLEALAPGGVLVVSGIPGGDSRIPLPAADLLRRLVLNNQLLFGTVNAAAGHFTLAVDDLLAATRRGYAVNTLITERYSPREALEKMAHRMPQQIKSVVEWSR